MLISTEVDLDNVPSHFQAYPKIIYHRWQAASLLSNMSAWTVGKVYTALDKLRT